MGKIASSKDLIMLLLYAKGHEGVLCESIRGRTRLMKMVFLFDKEVRGKFKLERQIPADAIPDFEPYDYGPFSATVFSDLEFLVDLGFIQVEPGGDSEPIPEELQEYEYWQAGAGPESEFDGPESEEEFSLTQIGREFVEDELLGTLSVEQLNVLHEFKARCTGANLRALLRYVYTKYPNMTTKSKIREALLSAE